MRVVVYLTPSQIPDVGARSYICWISKLPLKTDGEAEALECCWQDYLAIPYHEIFAKEFSGMTMRFAGLIVLSRSGLRMTFLCLCATALATGLSACAQIGYYAQASHGQLSLMAAAQPIDELLSDPDIDAKLRQRLAKAKQIREFAVSELGLPDNASYKSYADLQRPFALWNVVATPELSLRPLQWCFPVAGCVSYRGYYSKDDAQAFAATLRGDGYDVQVVGVPTYSTLGWFNDPLLSTFIRYPDGELARLIFHELAHQIVYVKDDTQFNESFATAVEEAGVERWFALHGDTNAQHLYADYKVRRNAFLELLLRYRVELARNYADIVSDDEKRRRKAEIFAALQGDYQILKASWHGFAGYDRWFAEPLSNAHLAAIATYHAFVPGFNALLRETGNFPDFYQAVIALAAIDKADRHQQLTALALVLAADR